MNRMSIKKIPKIFTIISVLLLSFISFRLEAQADTSSEYGITIVKYKLDSTQISANNLPTQPSGSDLGDTVAKSNNGDILSVFPGVEYKIEKVILKNGSGDTFELVPGSVAQTITTDANGRAHLSLGEGIYRITEQSSSLIPNPAAPIIIQLPTTLENGVKVNQVYIYPKSSIVTPGSVTSTPSSSKPYSSIPQTSGDLSSVFPLYLLLGGVVLIGGFSLVIGRKKIKKN